MTLRLEVGTFGKGDHSRWWMGFTPPKDLWVGVGELEGRPRWHWSVGLYCLLLAVRWYR